MAEPGVVLARRRAPGLRAAPASGKPAWKRYRGGQTTPIWIADLADSSVDEGPARQLERLQPDVGRRHDLLPLRPQRPGHPVRLRHDRRSRSSEALANDGLDIKSASAGPGAIVYEQFGAHPPVSTSRVGQAKTVAIRVAGDLPEVRPHFAKVEPKRIPELRHLADRRARRLRGARRDPHRARREGRHPQPDEHAGVAERDPAWSPDGKSIAYFSDESGEYALHIRDQNGMGELEDRPRHTAVVLLRAALVARQQEDRLHRQAPEPLVRRPGDGQRQSRSTRTTTDGFGPSSFDQVWSPDSKWLAYTEAAAERPARRLRLFAGRGEEAPRSPTA